MLTAAKIQTKQAPQLATMVAYTFLSYTAPSVSVSNPPVGGQHVGLIEQTERAAVHDTCQAGSC